MANRIKIKDRIAYTGMKIVLCSDSREVVGMMEHALIDWAQRKHAWLCANRARGFDGPAFDDSDSDDKVSGPGPHFCYVVYGYPYCSRIINS